LPVLNCFKKSSDKNSSAFMVCVKFKNKKIEDLTNSDFLCLHSFCYSVVILCPTPITLHSYDKTPFAAPGPHTSLRPRATQLAPFRKTQLRPPALRPCLRN